MDLGLGINVGRTYQDADLTEITGKCVPNNNCTGKEVLWSVNIRTAVVQKKKKKPKNMKNKKLCSVK